MSTGTTRQVTTSPAGAAYAVTPSDTADLPNGTARALYIGGAGDVNIVPVNGTAVVLSGALAGTILPVQCTRVKSTSTTATLIVALY